MDHRYPCTVYDPDALRDYCMTRCYPVWYCVPWFPPCPIRPVCQPRPEPRPVPKPVPAVHEVELRFCFPEHEEICSVDVRLLRLNPCCDGTAQAVFCVSVDYVDGCGCRRWETFRCRKELSLPRCCDHPTVCPEPEYCWHCGELSLTMKLICR